MGEGVKTIIFAIIAFAVIVAAVVSHPRQAQWKAGDDIGKPLFDEFDGDTAKRIKIVKYNEKLGKIREFKLARDKETDAWVIPSIDDYPADAKNRVSDATLVLDDLEILGVASEVRTDHKLYGVVSPDKKDVKLGDEGVGLLVAFEGAKENEELASLIIGHSVKGKDGQRFVRRPSLDAVHVVEIDPDKLSTKVEDWFEKDLLQLTSLDIEDIAIKNHTFRRGFDPPIQREFDFAAEYKDTKWNLVELTRYSNNQPIAGVLGVDEELDSGKLNDLKSAADNLEIESVFRKPEGLGHDLKVEEGFAEDLTRMGYHVNPKTRELVSAEGEVRIGTKDGVEYVLRFGNEVQLSSSSEDTEEDEGTGDSEETEEKEEEKHRLLFVMARMDRSKLPEPEMKDLPELPGGDASGTPSDDSGDEARDADTDDSSSKTAADNTAADEAESTETSEGETAVADDTAIADDAVDAKPAEGDAKEGDETDAKADKEAEEAEIVKERERISKENERKLNEYNEKVKKAKEKVAELNTRFGDWYYVVSDEKYKEIFLGVDELTKEKEDADVSGDGVDAFRDLQEKGLKKDEDDTPEAPTS